MQLLSAHERKPKRKSARAYQAAEEGFPLPRVAREAVENRKVPPLAASEGRGVRRRLRLRSSDTCATSGVWRGRVSVRHNASFSESTLRVVRARVQGVRAQRGAIPRALSNSA